jgi:hypothetical protein
VQQELGQGLEQESQQMMGHMQVQMKTDQLMMTPEMAPLVPFLLR